MLPAWEQRAALEVIAAGLEDEFDVSVREAVTSTVLVVSNTLNAKFVIHAMSETVLLVHGRCPHKFYVDLADPESIPDLLARLRLPM